jgi:hypothetical protein
MTQNSDSAKHAFFYLLAFFALGFVATAIGQVAFQLINKFIVETTTSYSGTYAQGVLRFIIAGPIYYLTTRKINSALAKNALDPDSAIRKWLTYVAIFVAAAIGIGDLIFVLNSFLAGELTLKFLLKAITIFAIVGGFGWYYFTDLHRQNFARDARVKTFGWVFIGVVIACLVTAFTLIDSPIRARELREDQNRVSELQQIAYSVRDFYTQNSALPENLDALVADSKILAETLRDPVTDEKYAYRALDATHFELCANFAFATPTDGFVDPAWQHEAGYGCFDMSISTKENYPTLDIRPVPAN